MTREKVVFYDFNGTALDDFRVAFTAINAIRTANKKPEVTATEYRDLFDMPITTLYKQHGLENIDMAHGQHIYGMIVKTLSPEMKFRPGLENILRESKQAGVRNIMASNSSVHTIKSKLEEFQLNQYFDEILGIDHPRYNDKKKLNNVAAYIADHKMHDASKIFIGDTAEEMDMASALRGTYVGIEGGYMSTSRIAERCPDELFFSNDFWIVRDMKQFRNDVLVPKHFIAG